MILTIPYLSRIAEDRNYTYNYTEQKKVLSENFSIRAEKQTYDLFLSHSYLDRSIVYALVDIFNKAHYTVYVDWMVDTALDRSQVNKATAETLRKQMNNCKGLAYVSTRNSSESKWCPWELGYSDGKKQGRCAILPIMQTDGQSFKGQEYLTLYPYIDYIEGDGFWVNDPDDNQKYTRLSQWLNGSELQKHL